MDHMTLYLFGCGCASLGFGARALATYVVQRITNRQELQAACDHVWRETTYMAAYPQRTCKWCKQQQWYKGDADSGHWEDR